MKKIRVLHVIDSLHLGGAQEVVLHLVQGSDPDRFDHEIATLHGHGVYWERMSSLGLKLHSLSPHKLLPLYIPTLAHLLKMGNFSILHCHLAASNILGKPIGRLFGVPAIVSHDHTNDISRAANPLVLTLDRWSNQYADAFAAVSTSCRDFLIQREGIPPEKISLVPNAVDTSWFHKKHFSQSEARQALHLPEKGLLVSGVGRLRPQKNFLLFLEIAAALVSEFPEIHFFVAGTGPEESILKRKALSLGIAPRVTFSGYVPDTRFVYSASDLLLMPSRFEGLPMTLLEAMAMELPVVASSLDGISEVIEDKVDGALCTPGEPAAFIAAAKTLLSNEALRKSMGEAARSKIVKQHSREGMVAQVESIYSRLLS